MKFWLVFGMIIPILSTKSCTKSELVPQISYEESPPIPGTESFGHIVFFEAGFDQDTVLILSKSDTIFSEVISTILSGGAGHCRVDSIDSSESVYFQMNGKKTHGIILDPGYRFIYINVLSNVFSMEYSNIFKQSW